MKQRRQFNRRSSSTEDRYILAFKLIQLVVRAAVRDQFGRKPGERLRNVPKMRYSNREYNATSSDSVAAVQAQLKTAVVSSQSLDGLRMHEWDQSLLKISRIVDKGFQGDRDIEIIVGNAVAPAIRAQGIVIL